MSYWNWQTHDNGTAACDGVGGAARSGWSGELTPDTLPILLAAIEEGSFVDDRPERGTAG
jgi:hypothetical protein